jgi:heat shock protein HslJ
MLGRLVAPALPTRSGGEAPGVAPVFALVFVPMTDPDVTGPTATSDALAGSEWAIVRLGDAPVLDADQPLVIAFGHDGRVSGSTGVNQLTASYSLTAEYLTFGPLATTRRAGTPELMEQEHLVVQSLAGMCSFELTAHTLSIDGPIGRVDLVSTAPLPVEPLPTHRELSRPTEA